jgi:hypothetical protein
VLDCYGDCSGEEKENSGEVPLNVKKRSSGKVPQEDLSFTADVALHVKSSESNPRLALPISAIILAAQRAPS